MNPKLEPLAQRLIRREGNICDTLQEAFNMGIQYNLDNYKELRAMYDDLAHKYNDLLYTRKPPL
jgi:hypothetical protein